MLKWIIVPLVILAFILRTLFIFQGGVSFHYDMGRDAFEAQKIWKDHDLKLLGPPTSTPGLYHGVLYYYLIAPFYMIGNGDPRVVAVFLAFINSLVIIPIVLLAKNLFKSNKWAVFSGLLFAVSFEATQYSSWVSNPAPSVLTVSMFFLALYWWQKGKTYAVYLAILFAALSTQFQFFLIYLFLLIVVFGILFKLKVSFKQLLLATLITILGLINFFIVMIKFGSLSNILSGFFNISTSGQIDFRPTFSELFLNYIGRFTEVFTLNFFPTNVFLGGVITLLCLYAIRKQKVLLFFLLSNIPIFIFGGHSNIYASTGLVVPAILAFIILLQNTWRLNKLFVCVIVFLSLLSNMYTIFKYNPQGQLMLVIPNDMNLKNELSLIDQTYKQAGGKPFSINTLTLPLWTNTTWAYLYWWYGQTKYGYTPQFYGRDQNGLPGADLLKRIDKPLEKSFFIIEPANGIPTNIFNEEIEAENSKTELLGEEVFGTIRLQIRSPKF